jgi:hypothetical protein
MIVEKICIFCDHFRFLPACRDCSEYTPGEDAAIYCGADHWEVSWYGDNERSYRNKLLTAGTCADFNQIDLEELLREK